MKRPITIGVSLCLQLCLMIAFSPVYAQSPEAPVVNWLESTCQCRSGSFAACFGKSWSVEGSGLAIAELETGDQVRLTTADGLLAGYSNPPDDIYTDDSGLLWAYWNLHMNDQRLEWQVFDGLRWAGLGDVGLFGVVDNRRGIWTRYTDELAHYELNPPAAPRCTEYYAEDYGLDDWPYWLGIDSSGWLWGRPLLSSALPAVYSFDGRELRRMDPPGDFRPHTGAVDRQDRKWFGNEAYDGRVARLDGENWQIWGSEDGLPAFRWRFGAFDQQSRPWAMGRRWESGELLETCIVHFDGIGWEDVAPPDSVGFSLCDIASDEKGRLFALGSIEDVSAVFRLNGDTWVGPLSSAGPMALPPTDGISEVGIDREDGVWFACNSSNTGESRIMHLGSEGQTSFDDFADDGFGSVRVDQTNNKWFGGTKLVITQDMEHGYFACTPPHYIRDIEFGPYGTAYITSIGQLYRIKNGEVTVEELPWFDGQVTDLSVSQDGVIYLAFGDDTDVYNLQGGIYFNAGDGWENLPIPPHWHDRQSWPVLGIEQDTAGTIWALIYGALSKFDGSAWTTVEHDGETVFGTPIPQPPLTLDSQDRLWFYGSVYEDNDYTKLPRMGLCRFDGSHSVAWTQEDGILPDIRSCDRPSDGAGVVSEDQYGNIWATARIGISLLLAEESLVLGPNVTVVAAPDTGLELELATAFQYMAPSANADLYVALQAPTGQIFYVAPQEAEPPFPIFYAAFEGSMEFLEPGPGYQGPGSFPNTPDMKDLAAPPSPLPDPPGGDGPTGLALFAYPVPYFANVPLPAYTTIADVALLNTTIPEGAPTGTYTFHIGITAPASISNVYRTASTTFEVIAD